MHRTKVKYENKQSAITKRPFETAWKRKVHAGQRPMCGEEILEFILKFHLPHSSLNN